MDFYEILQAVTSVVGTMSLIATMTPNKTDDKAMQVVCSFINFLGANFGAAKNK